MSVELPKDAEGREIPLDTQVLYDSDGTEFFTDKFMYIRVTDEWWFFGHFGSSTSTHQVVATRLHLSPHDSWEKLLDDLNEAGNARYDEDAYERIPAPCRYFGADKGIKAMRPLKVSCANCRAERMMAFDNALADTDCYTLMVIDFLKTLGVEVEDA